MNNQEKIAANKDENKSYIDFDGKSKSVGNFNNVVKDDYEISINLFLTDSLVANTEDTKVSPPMPFLISNIAFYKTNSSEFRIFIKDLLNYNFTIESSGWFHLLIRANNSSKRTAIYINNQLRHFENCYSNLSGTYTLGCGHYSRYWKGQIEYLKIITNSANNDKVLVDLNTKNVKLISE